MEETVEGSEMLIGQVGLQFNLSDDVFLNFSLFDPFFGHFLQNTKQSKCLLESHEYVSKCTFSQFVNYLKIVDGYLSWGFC